METIVPAQTSILPGLLNHLLFILNLSKYINKKQACFFHRHSCPAKSNDDQMLQHISDNRNNVSF